LSSNARCIAMLHFVSFFSLNAFW